MATSVSFYLLPPTQPSLQPPSPNPHTRANTLPSLLAPRRHHKLPSSADTPKTHDNGESSKTSLPPSKINFLVPSTISTYAPSRSSRRLHEPNNSQPTHSPFRQLREYHTTRIRRQRHQNACTLGPQQSV